MSHNYLQPIGSISSFKFKMHKIQLFLFFIVFVNMSYFIISVYHDFTLNSIIMKLGRYADSTSCNRTNKTRIFCIVLTKPDNFHTKALAAYQTWAHKCDNYKFISVIPEQYKNDKKYIINKITHDEDYLDLSNYYTDDNLDELAKLEKDKMLPSPSRTSLELMLNYTVLQPAGLFQEKYSKLTDKVYYTLIDIYKRYKNDYDWFLKADDDTFVFVDNLRSFLADKNECSPVKYGYNFQILLKWQCGGAGYVLSKESFNRISLKLIENYRYCPNTGIEDKDVSRCLRRLDVLSGQSLDEFGRERFHHTNIYSNYMGFQDFHIKLFAQNVPKKGLDCCSDTSISFHYERPEEMYKLAEILKKHEKGASNRTSSGDTKNQLTFKDIIEELGIIEPKNKS